jgi:hypothetical protein
MEEGHHHHHASPSDGWLLGGMLSLSALGLLPEVAMHSGLIDPMTHISFLSLRDFCATGIAGVSQIPVLGDLFAQAGFGTGLVGTALLLTGDALSEWLVSLIPNLSDEARASAEYLLKALAKGAAVGLMLVTMAHGVGEGLGFLALIGGHQGMALDIMQFMGAHPGLLPGATSGIGAVLASSAPALHCVVMAMGAGAKAWLGDEVGQTVKETVVAASQWVAQWRRSPLEQALASALLWRKLRPNTPEESDGFAIAGVFADADTAEQTRATLLAHGSGIAAIRREGEVLTLVFTCKSSMLELYRVSQRVQAPASPRLSTISAEQVHADRCCA